MSNDKEIINKLFKVVAQQQKIITKIAQTMGAPTMPPAGDMRVSVEADIYDLIYGRGATIPAFGNKIQVHYAKTQSVPNGNVLLVGLTVPDAFQAKWDAMKNSIEMALKNKYGVTGVAWKL